MYMIAMSKTDPKADADIDPLDEFLCFSIYSASHAFNRAYKPILDRLGLTYSQYLVLTALGSGGEQAVGAIGERLRLESNTLTPLIKRLEANGLVLRRRDLADERIVRVGLTPAGLKLAKEARRVPEAIRQATGLAAGELEDLNQRIRALREKLTAGN